MGKVLTIAGGLLALVLCALAVTQVNTVAVTGSAESGATGTFFASSWLVFVILSIAIAGMLLIGAVAFAITQK